MAAQSLAQAVTDSFYAWETRGRGWMLAEYPLSLEPPFRPFFLLPQHILTRAPVIDDGRRATLASFVIDRVKQLLRRTPEMEAPTPYEEQAAFAAFDPGPLSVLRILAPADFVCQSEVMAQLLSALSAAQHPIAFELIGVGGTVTLQIVCAAFDAESVAAHVEGFMPEVAIIPGNDRLTEHWDDDATRCIVDFGLAHEFFLPLQGAEAFRIDPFVPLVTALARARHGEFVIFQVLFERTRNPWAGAIHEALDDGDGGCLIGDAPWFVAKAKEKTASLLYAVVLRVGAQAETEERSWELTRNTQAFILQFERPNGNTLAPLTNDGYCNREHAASLVARQSLRTGMLLSADELVGLVHLPDQSVRHPTLVRAELRTKELPAVARGHEFVLGAHAHRGLMSEASLDLESRFAHAWVIGGSGTGKSTLVANMVLQDIAAGHGVAVLDPHGDLVDDIVARIPKTRMNDVVLFDPADVEYPIGFNIIGATTEVERNLLASDLVAIFRRFATSWGDTMTTVLTEAVLALLEHPDGGTLLDLKRFLVDDSVRKRMLSAITDCDIRFFWEKEYPVIGARSLGPLLSRLDGFLRSRIVRNIVGQSRAKLDLADVMQGGKVFLARLAKGQIGEENSFLLGSLLLAKLNQLALMRQALPASERRAFFCYADEFQHFTTPSMESLATEGRKYRFGLILAHQTLAQLSETPRIESALLANCHTRIAFRIGEGDAKKLADGFAFFGADDLVALSRGEAVARIGGANNDFNLRTYRLTHVDADDSEANRCVAVAASRERYGVPRSELVALLASAYVPPDEPTTQTEPVKATLVSAPMPPRLPPQAAPVRGDRKAVVVAPADSGRGGSMHKYLQHLVKRLAEERGFRAVIEGTAGVGQADLVLHREPLIVGCEISITTDPAHEVENLKKCVAAGFTHVLFISPEKKQRDKVAAVLRAELMGAPISVIGPEDIVTALDALGNAQGTSESVVRGYKVKVTRQDLSPQEVASRRKAVAEVIARGLGR